MSVEKLPKKKYLLPIQENLNLLKKVTGGRKFYMGDPFVEAPKNEKFGGKISFA